MNNYFTVKEAAKIVNTTSETLRHYDRIGLVKPCHRDEISQYRYYSEQELIRLQTVELLKCMDLSLAEIKEILQIDDLAKVVKLLKQAEKNAEQKIERLQYAKTKIKRAYTEYQKKLDGTEPKTGDYCVSRIPSRVIMISDSLENPSLKNLWNYHSHFYRQIDRQLHTDYIFEDMAGMITTPEKTRLFATCLKYPTLEGLIIFPEGNYLCADCTEANRTEILQTVLRRARSQFSIIPKVVIYHIVISGILQWKYQIQVYLDGEICI